MRSLVYCSPFFGEEKFKYKKKRIKRMEVVVMVVARVVVRVVVGWEKWGKLREIGVLV